MPAGEVNGLFRDCVRLALRTAAMWLLVALGLALVLFVIAPAFALEARNPETVSEFRKSAPCPATGKYTGACPGYVVDHMYPLCAGGKDHPLNMQWQDKQSSYAKDRLERELCRCKGEK